MWLKLIGLVVPLGLDTFAVAAALGMAGLNRLERIRVTGLFTAFETGMPLVGFFGGAIVGKTLGSLADYLAIAILIALGLYMLWPRKEEAEEQRLSTLAWSRGFAALGLGLSISLDELAIGFTIGLLQLPVILVIVLIGIQTIIVSQLGLRLGHAIGERIREGAERIAGLALAGLGLLLGAEKLFH
jgi:putative Mn2+ efflux pump MntP